MPQTGRRQATGSQTTAAAVPTLWQRVLGLPLEVAVHVVLQLSSKSKLALRQCCKEARDLVDLTIESIQLCNYVSPDKLHPPTNVRFPALRTLKFTTREETLYTTRWVWDSDRVAAFLMHCSPHPWPRLQALVFHNTHYIGPATFALLPALLPGILELEVSVKPYRSDHNMAGPSIAAVCRLTNLESLTLRGFSSSPSSQQQFIYQPVSLLTRLRQLHLSDLWHVRDQDLDFLSTLVELAELSLEGMRCSGQGLSHLQPLHKLGHVSLISCTGLNDAGMASIATLVSVTSLDFGCDETATTDDGLGELSQLTSLRDLRIYNHSLAGRALDVLSNGQLVRLHVDDVDVAGIQLQPRWLAHLRVLHLTFWNGNSSAHLFQHLRLQELRVDAEVTNDAMQVISRQSGLTTLKLGNMRRVAASAISNTLGSMTQLQSLQLRSCHDQDILAVVSRLRKLEYLWLSDMPRVGDLGMMPLLQLRALTKLVLRDMAGVTAVTLAAMATLPSMLSIQMYSSIDIPEWDPACVKDIAGNDQLEVLVTCDEEGVDPDDFWSDGEPTTSDAGEGDEEIDEEDEHDMEDDADQDIDLEGLDSGDDEGMHDEDDDDSEDDDDDGDELEDASGEGDGFGSDQPSSESSEESESEESDTDSSEHDPDLYDHAPHPSHTGSDAPDSESSSSSSDAESPSERHSESDEVEEESESSSESGSVSQSQSVSQSETDSEGGDEGETETNSEADEDDSESETTDEDSSDGEGDEWEQGDNEDGADDGGEGGDWETEDTDEDGEEGEWDQDMEHGGCGYCQTRDGRGWGQHNLCRYQLGCGDQWGMLALMHHAFNDLEHRLHQGAVVHTAEATCQPVRVDPLSGSDLTSGVDESDDDTQSSGSSSAGPPDELPIVHGNWHGHYQQYL